MATLAAVCDAFKATFESVGLRVYEYEPDDLNPPCVVLEVGDSPLPYTFGQATVEYSLVASIYVASVSDRAGQLGLKSYISWTGPNSIAQAIAQMPTLRSDPTESTAGSSCLYSASVRGFSGYDPQRFVNGNRYFYARVELQAITRGDS